MGRNPEESSLVQLAANGAPAGEPEVWDECVLAFNPHLAHTPEPEPVEVSPAFAEAAFNVADYLAEERAKDLLRFSTAGSVDDGKSTLIGRLLYDTQSVYDDQVRSIEGKGTTAPGVLDLALLTDGLRAEREQGITIDVAYRYFATPRRKFIIADTPGHEQYTRNMATGASTADVAIVLVDARKGVLRQSRRHAYITALLGVRHIIIAVNKMDLVDWSETVFAGVREEFERFFASLAMPSTAALHFIPVSALAGDNVVTASEAMPWYPGPTLLSLLEELPSSSHSDADAPFRFALQRISRPNLDFRGFAGQIAAGTIRPGDRVLAIASGQSSRVARIVTFDGDLEVATAPLSVTLTLEDEIDLSRGDLLVAPESGARTATRFTASLVWMDSTPLDLSRRYLLKQTSRTVQAQVRNLVSTVDFDKLEQNAAELDAEQVAPLVMNSVGIVELETLLPLTLDPYSSNRHTGSFILIDAQTNATVAAGMVREIGDAQSALHAALATGVVPAVTAAEREARWGHTGAYLTLTGDAAVADALEHVLFEQGAFVLRADVPQAAAAGAIVLATAKGAQTASESMLTVRLGDTEQSATLADEIAKAVEQAVTFLRASGVLRRAAGTSRHQEQA